MQLETSTSSLDTQMAKENAIKSVVTSGKESLNQLGSWITANAAKATLFTALTFTAPAVFGQTEVAKNEVKNKTENTISPAKKDTNAVELKVEPEWRRELDKAILNTLDYMNKNYSKFSTDILTMDINAANIVNNRHAKITSYSKIQGNLIKIIAERPFNEKEQQSIKNIQKNLQDWSKEGLHSYIDQLAYLVLQEINVFVSTFETPLVVKNNQ